MAGGQDVIEARRAIDRDAFDEVGGELRRGIVVEEGDVVDAVGVDEGDARVGEVARGRIPELAGDRGAEGR